MTKPELFEYLEFKANLEREMARKLASWKSGNKATPTAVPQQTQPAAPNENYTTGTIKRIFGHKANNRSGNYVKTIMVELDEGENAKYNITFHPNCVIPNWLNVYEPLEVPGITKDSTIEQQLKIDLNYLAGKKVSFEMKDGKIEKFTQLESDW